MKFFDRLWANIKYNFSKEKLQSDTTEMKNALPGMVNSVKNIITGVATGNVPMIVQGVSGGLKGSGVPEPQAPEQSGPKTMYKMWDKKNIYTMYE